MLAKRQPAAEGSPECSMSSFLAPSFRVSSPPVHITPGCTWIRAALHTDAQFPLDLAPAGSPPSAATSSTMVLSTSTAAPASSPASTRSRRYDPLCASVHMCLHNIHAGLSARKRTGGGVSLFCPVAEPLLCGKSPAIPHGCQLPGLLAAQETEKGAEGPPALRPRL